MIGRLIGTMATTVFTTCTVGGIALLIASDFNELGQAIGKFQAWFKTEPKQVVSLGKADALKGADNITFFKKEPIKGSALQVTTGIAFASIADVIAGKTINRWCYIRYGEGKFTKQLDLGSQRGSKNPVYTDTTVFSDEQLKGFGLSAEKLASLGRSHCLLEGFDPRNLGDGKTTVLPDRKKPSSEASKPPDKPKKPAKVWDWQSPKRWKGQSKGRAATHTSNRHHSKSIPSRAYAMKEVI